MPDTEPYPPDGTAEPNRAELVVQRPPVFVMVIGGWVVAAPLILDHAAAGVAFAGITDVTVGTALVILAAIRLRHRAAAWLNLVNVALGAVLIAAPFVQGFADTAQRATLNDVLAGLMVIMLAGVSWLVDRPAKSRASVTSATALPESVYASRTPVTSGSRTPPSAEVSPVTGRTPHRPDDLRRRPDREVPAAARQLVDKVGVMGEQQPPPRLPRRDGRRRERAHGPRLTRRASARRRRSGRERRPSRRAPGRRYPGSTNGVVVVSAPTPSRSRIGRL
ncbi:hypothetical protein AMIS_40820 [Actinoplanes missouriensis 431]|uniref:SPW repeat-containing integral membrane domain-containing protein n=1 Tax=Actinoplanes missouriensis (strain ATCC 14538 / DSM 43046 / CBS 188.64 / JCM 3121 / NBRC 102363 / NCIMB 12654 / NRRL B-3342 / UNCC 431) TaxID=512565 RepID=I0H8G5_ACTM4|nr:SPW repeat protein [Actinoplanes missouriensis]BAL89302.1 hypothetical protein AMIS_40820 [Actinoplanes missouriensis 431]